MGLHYTEKDVACCPVDAQRKAIMCIFWRHDMEAESINQITSSLEDLHQRVSELRRYL